MALRKKFLVVRHWGRLREAVGALTRGAPTFIGVRRFVQGVREEAGAEQGDERQLLHLLFVSWGEKVGAGSAGGGPAQRRAGAAVCWGRAGMGLARSARLQQGDARCAKTPCSGETEARSDGGAFKRGVTPVPVHEPHAHPVGWHPRGAVRTPKQGSAWDVGHPRGFLGGRGVWGGCPSVCGGVSGLGTRSQAAPCPRGTPQRLRTSQSHGAAILGRLQREQSWGLGGAKKKGRMSAGGAGGFTRP